MANGKRAADPFEASKEGNGESSAKRSRVSRACDQCRASREKCVRADSGDTCRTCIALQRSCSYNEQPKKRGIQPNYIRTLELTLAWLLQCFPEAESQLIRCLPEESDDVHKLLSGKAHETSEALHVLWRSCLICKQIDQLLSGDVIQQDGQRLSRHTGSRTDRLDERLATHDWPDSSTNTMLDDLASGVEPGTGVHGGLSPLTLPPQPTLGQREVHQQPLKLPENALLLLEYYFAFTHCWLPMTEKHSLLKLIYSYPAAGLSREQASKAEHAELWSILALAASQLSDQTTGEEILRIRAIAESLIPSSTDNISFEVPHLRAMLALALIDISEARILAAWLRVGTVVSLLLLFRVLQSLGVTEKWCRHIHLVAFVLETALAEHLNVTTHLSVPYIEGIGFISEDGLDEWAPWHDPAATPYRDKMMKSPTRSFSSLNQLVRLSLQSSNHATSSDGSNLDSAKRTSPMVFSLLSNASQKHGRVPPSSLVFTSATGLSGIDVAVQHSLKGSNIPAASPTDYSKPPNKYSGSSDPANGHNSRVGDRYVSIPAEDSSTTSRNSPNGLNNDQSATADQALPIFAPQLPLPQVDDEAGSMADADIFQEFDALLERQDSTQNTQFYQNLGFAPDVALAEFFGDDYQPSDPLLTYLNPALYGARTDDNDVIEG